MGIDSGNIHDSKIAVDMLSSEAINIKNKKFLADRGYDSNEFKNLLLSNNNTFIIPINNKNTYTYEMNDISNNTNASVKNLVDTKNELCRFAIM